MLSRRDFLKIGLGGGVWAVMQQSGLASVHKVLGKRATPQKIIILGLDGMDPRLLSSLMEAGKLPHFQQLRASGGFRPLLTSIPPQSPVAWSNFIAGTDPGGHAIFDFIHRDTETYFPYLSTSKTEAAKRTISLGDYVLPLSQGKVEQLRKGKAFWQILEEHDIPATVFKMPSNFPPVATRQRTLSGMGTPDLLGTYGMFSYYTTDPAQLKEDIGGGVIYKVEVNNHRMEASLRGPRNLFRKATPDTTVGFTVYVDPRNPVAKIVIQGNELILKEGEWSRWVKVEFSLIPTQRVSGICQFYLKEIRPHFKLYVTPVNISPEDPAMPIATPESYSRELHKKFGYFWTKGLPADTKALDHGVLDDGEFLAQDDLVLHEREAMFDYELERFESGLLFYYVSSTDQRQHMFWRLTDEEHPAYDRLLAAKYGNAIENIYIEMDALLAKAMKKADKDTVLIVMSDHGFLPFRRSFNLNSWLKENGYLTLIDPRRQGEASFFMNTDWGRTRAFALGLNGIYVNQQGREAEGVVPAVEKQALIQEIARKLEQVTDPQTGERAIYRVYIASEVYHGAYVDQAPDLIVGYSPGYRASWATPLGRIPRSVFEDNTDKWSGDHCMAAEVLPGIVLANREIKVAQPALYDLTATILSIMGITQPPEMIGTPIL